MQQSNLPNLPIPHNNNYFKLFLHNLYLFSKCYHFWVLFFLTAYKIFPPFLPRQLTYPEMAWPMWNPNLTHSCGSPRIGHRSSASGGGRPSGRSTRRIYCCTPRVMTLGGQHPGAVHNQLRGGNCNAKGENGSVRACPRPF